MNNDKLTGLIRFRKARLCNNLVVQVQVEKTHCCDSSCCEGLVHTYSVWRDATRADLPLLDKILKDG